MTTMMKKTRSVKRARTAPAPKATIQVRVDAKTKDRAEKFFKGYGITTSDGVRMFINDALKKKSLPFDPGTPHIPNAETRKAIEESISGKGQKYTVEEFL